MVTNGYGAALDRNNYAPSVVSSHLRCYICGRRTGKMDRHEVYHGPYREKSKMLGCWVWLCYECHDRLHHKGGGLDAELKAAVQPIVMAYYEWTEDDFRARFGKSYLG